MASRPEPAALRRLSAIELFSSSRHFLGIYRCVTVTCRYQSAAGGALDDAALYPALARVVSAQPMLRVGILDQDSSQARFAHLAAIDLGDHVCRQTLTCADADAYDARLAEHQAALHDQLWPDVETRAPWRLSVLSPTADAPFCDVVFAFHHALLDGTSGRLFHEQLLAALNSPDPPAAPLRCRLAFPDPPQLPEAQDDAVGFTNSFTHVARALWNQLAPAALRPRAVPWHGKPIDFALAYRTRARAVDVPPAAVARLVAACRAHGTSLTGLVHALVLASLARRLPAAAAPRFAASTPINLRSFAGPDADPPLLRCLITSLTHVFPPDAVAALRDAAADLDALVWSTARRVRRELAARLARLPRDDAGGLIKYIGDWAAYWGSKDGQPRSESWEVSNIGVLRQDAAAPWSIARVFFTNGSMVAGPALGINVATAAAGPLTATISWQETVVPGELVDGLAADLAALTARFHDTGRWCWES